MKLTSKKLKQLIRESMEGSEYYRKLLSLMTTEEGFMQAQSLFEMIEEKLDPKERGYLRTYFDVIELAKEVNSLEAHAIAVEEKYHKLEDELVSQHKSVDAEVEAARSELIDTIKTYNNKKKELDRGMMAMHQHGNREIYDVVAGMMRKIERS